MVEGARLEDLKAALGVRPANREFAVEAAGAHERWVQQIAAVGGAHENDPHIRREAIHLRQQLIQRLLPLLIRMLTCPSTAGSPKNR